ncbi:MAG: hypothetical protein HWQ44_00105 [Nostoc sp. JL34]|uniref:hypothetical protein n=1 Tax=Nostoc sp. JL34 TaxID=2815397 RepID=UPI001D93D4C0|nr:hypothetical protein [Nostoc sp. JL34]MBN3881417.1 hypothetical protein [Nostoc sp. JL34]
MTSNTKPSQTLSSPPSNCSELQTESDKTANKAILKPHSGSWQLLVMMKGYAL